MKKSSLRRLLLIFIAIVFTISNLPAQQVTPRAEKKIQLKHWMTPEEAKLKHLIGRDFIPTDPPQGPVTNIAEFNRMQSVLIAYEFGISYQVIAEMSQDCKVTTLVANATEETYVRNKYIQNGVVIENCSFLYASTDSYWTRDYGPWFVFDGNNEFGIVDFPYNRPRPNDDNVPVKVAASLGINLFGMNVEHTGGNYMTDGMGISSSTDLVWVENPGQTHVQIAQKFQDYLGISNYHVVADPNNTYIDHIDCWGKFLDVDKVLIRSVPTSHPQYAAIEATAAYYAAQTSSYGTPYQVFRVNTPNNQPYTNSLILNKKVIVPIMNSANDAAAIAAYQAAMPGYEVVGFTGTWESTDALHCRAIGIADLGMLHIRHVALLGNQPNLASYPITATIKTFSGQPVYTDSAIIYYRVNGAAWQKTNMTNTSGETWTGSIPGAASGSEIQYYLYVADQSGRRETHPFIGQPDPHNFFVSEQTFAHIAINPTSLTLEANSGQSVDANLFIQNTGELELIYSIVANTAVLGITGYPVPNSPSASAYDYNTNSESGWTNLVVNKTGEISNWQIHYTWITDSYPEESSFHVESPAGTQAVIASASPSGTYTIDLTSFDGEEMAGTWKIWIEDTYGDGGHQATTITTTFTTLESLIPGLSANPTSGTVQPGSSQTIVATCDASQLTPGLYSAAFIVASNDPDSPEIEIPVTFTVTASEDITVTPDTLWFLTLDDMMLGKTVNISNQTTSAILINEITEWGTNFAWMINPPLPVLPYNLPAGENLELNVVILIPPAKMFNMLYDNMNITSEIGNHTVVVAWDSDLIASSLAVAPDTLFFETPDQAYTNGIPFTITNTGNLGVMIYDMTFEGFFAYIPQSPVQFPYVISVGESLEFTVFVHPGVVPATDFLVFEDININTQLGEFVVTVAAEDYLISDIKKQSKSGNLLVASPNPFNESTTITFNLQSANIVKIEVLDMNGKLITTLFEGISDAGKHQLNWNGNDNTGKKGDNGVYFVKVTSGNEVRLTKVVKMK